jgi:hypothetical protein
MGPEQESHYKAMEDHLDRCSVCQSLARAFVDREDGWPQNFVPARPRSPSPPEGAFITIEPTPLGAVTVLESDTA